MKSRSVKTLIGALVILWLTPIAALAHSGSGLASGLSAGFLHPFSGLDHLLAMFAVGLFAAQLGGRALWSLPTLFVSVMLLGGILAQSGIVIPYAEQGILASFLVLGLLVAGAVRLPLSLTSGMISFFALAHGHAHGSEAPLSQSFAFYALGFALATALLHAIGLSIGVVFQRISLAPLSRLIGAMIALMGIYSIVA